MTLIEREHRDNVIIECQNDANTPKHRLIELCDKLYEAGAYRKARTLDGIIGKLETWQNT
jgi:hypothetical protein